MKSHGRAADNGREIIHEIYHPFVLLGADSELLGQVGSLRHSLPIEDVLLGGDSGGW